MAHLPLLSVIIPVYNVEDYLQRCLTSVTDQSYDNLEILLVDDGSADDSGAICDRWAAKDSRIRVTHTPNRGGGAARNTALDQATGELLAFVDSDDYIAPDMFSYLYSLLEMGADVAECGYREVSGDDCQWDTSSPEPVRYTPEAAMTCHIQDKCWRQLIWNKLYRRSLAENVRFPVGTGIDDEYFTYQLLGNASALIRSDRVCYAYRQTPGSIMHRPYSLKRLNGIRAKEERLGYLARRFPELKALAGQELLFACLMAMQGSLQGLKGEELAQAKSYLLDVVRKLGPLDLSREPSAKRRILLAMAEKNLSGTAKMLSFLEAIHLLS